MKNKADLSRPQAIVQCAIDKVEASLDNEQYGCISDWTRYMAKLNKKLQRVWKVWYRAYLF